MKLEIVISKNHISLQNHIILLGFRYLASSIPLISLSGVAIGAGLTFNIYYNLLYL